MNGAAISGGSPGSPTPDWTVQGIGDFNGDGKADILWRHTSGALYTWFMDGTRIPNSGVPGNQGTDWSVQGVGDFNGDHKADIVWRHTSGGFSTWFMSGTSVLNTSGAASLHTNTAEGNTLGGFLVSGSGNALDDNNAKNSGGRGFDITGRDNLLKTNGAERSAGPEFVIGPNNIDGHSNSANGSRFSFPVAGGTFE